MEHLLKEDILGPAFEEDEVRKRVRLVREVEVNAIKEADAVVAVSAEEGAWAEEVGARQVTVLPNGVSASSQTSRARSFVQSLGLGERYCLFVGSAHWPNADGLLEMFKEGLGCLAPDESLVVAGAVRHLVVSDSRFESSPNLREKTIFLGELDGEDLSELLAKAHAIVLPITSGGGTNLKTAEAIWAGKHVVATTKAMRGFESFADAPGVSIADTPAEFKRELRRAMDSPLPVISSEEREKRKSVLWESSLRGLEDLLHSLEGQ